MQSWAFKSVVLSNEINLNAIASHFGINKKFKWEEPLILSDRFLKGVLKEVDNKWVYIFYFGSLVFINMEFHETQDILKYLKNIDLNLKNNDIINDYTDEYKLEVDTKHDYSLYNDLMTSNEFLPYYLDIISLVLAKSTCLKKIEIDIDKLLDGIENIINYLNTGKFNMSDEDIAKTSAKVLTFKYNTISSLMLLDKPKAAWDNENIENFYLQMASLFDLDERYKKIHHKTEILKDITDVFATLTHERRATKLEIMVIVLILFELIISIVEFILKF
ncbi:RMD1 family protein [Clostridium sp. DJ247]|uniref:RMD1 family protein n=1 Tax=Clostridium sp. DJ247 TaxID=2726188 RepID=UPI0016233C3B|nr:RMD1 family protein [Clostridium sp. DJ247]MBC2579713.1 RMD1 family protein [Clostridium sp. DJ247]